MDAALVVIVIGMLLFGLVALGISISALSEDFQARSSDPRVSPAGQDVPGPLLNQSSRQKTTERTPVERVRGWIRSLHLPIAGPHAHR